MKFISGLLMRSERRGRNGRTGGGSRFLGEGEATKKKRGGGRLMEMKCGELSGHNEARNGKDGADRGTGHLGWLPPT
jgi:hypothetical protein